MVRDSVISQRTSFFGTPEITILEKGARFSGWGFQDFRTAHNDVSQTAIHGNRQSLGAATVIFAE